MKKSTNILFKGYRKIFILVFTFLKMHGYSKNSQFLEEEEEEEEEEGEEGKTSS